MLDQYNRNIHYMRLSITDRCNYRCSYCKSFTPLEHKDILSYEEILKICTYAISLGIDTFKVTGGEPCARLDYLSFIQRLKSLEGCKKVTITTNGYLLEKEDLDTLKEADIDGINVSIDTLDPEHYRLLTQVDGIEKVISNVLYARKIGLYIKINCVLLDELSESEILDLIHFGKRHDIPVRFIELMPMKDNKRAHRTKEDVLQLLSNVYKEEKEYGNGPACYYRSDQGLVGFIEPIHGKFCDSCNRIRLTSTGFLKACLFHKDGKNIRKYIDQNLEEVMREVIYHKPQAHDFEKRMVGMSMSEIGG